MDLGINLSQPIYSGGAVRNSVRAADTRVSAGRAQAIWRALCRIGGPLGAAVLLLGALLVVVALVVGAVELGRYAVSALDRNGSTAECRAEGATGSPARGALPKAKVVLTPKSPEVTWAFDASRGEVPLPIVILNSQQDAARGPGPCDAPDMDGIHHVSKVEEPRRRGREPRYDGAHFNLRI